MSTDPVRRARSLLLMAAEPGRGGLWDLIEEVGPVEAVDRLTRGHAPGELARQIDPARVAKAARAVDASFEQAQSVGARLVIPEDKEWPGPVFEGLRWLDPATEAAAPPLGLWVRGVGTLAEACVRSIAVVGARAATTYGTHVASEIAFGLADRGWTVVSGGAYGIDGAAHRGALASEGMTVAALACGVDRPYPSGQSALFDRIAAQGLLISEWAPGSTPQRFRFLVRNRVIAAMARGTVVVEAAARSGARQTARIAAELSRSVLAVPGSVTSTMSVGTHALIRDQNAALVTTAEDVLEVVAPVGEAVVRTAQGAAGTVPELALDLAKVLAGFPARGVVDAGSLAKRAGVDLPGTLRALPRLIELGWVESGDGGYRTAPRRDRSAGTALRT